MTRPLNHPDLVHVTPDCHIYAGLQHLLYSYSRFLSQEEPGQCLDLNSRVRANAGRDFSVFASFILVFSFYKLLRLVSKNPPRSTTPQPLRFPMSTVCRVNFCQTQVLV